MIRNPIIPLLFVLLAAFTGSCYTSELTLNVLEPAEIKLPSAIQRISILPLPGPPSTSYDSLRYQKPEHDSLVRKVKMGYIHGIHEVLDLSPRFQKVVITDTSAGDFTHDNLFYWNELQEFCIRDTTDIILILSKAVTYDYFVNVTGNIWGDVILNDYILTNKTKWLFYAPFQEKLVAKHEFSDTVLIKGGFTIREFANIYYDVCYSLGQRFGGSISPHWNESSRVLFTGPGKNLKDAATFAGKNHWYKATLLWNELVEDENPGKASRAAFNIALAFERDDELDQAFSWAVFADSLHRNVYTNQYVKTLKARIKMKELLDVQMTGE
jgi:hypothetical protein